MDGNGHEPDLSQLVVQSSLERPPQPKSPLPWLTPQAAVAAQMAWNQQLRTHASGLEGATDMASPFSTQQIPLQYIDPLFDPILIVFPQDNIRELNRRLRHYFKYEPFIRSAIEFHTETPISDFELVCPASTEIQEYFNDFKDRVNLLDHIVNIARDYWLLGESFLYGNWDEHKQEFGSFVQLPPEEVEVKSAYVMPDRVFVLRPNKELQRLHMSQNPADQALDQLMQQYNPRYTQALKQGRPFVLDSNRLVVLQRSLSGYSNRGISPVLSVLKDLLFEDYLILYRMVLIQRHSFPLRIFKLGSAEKGFIPPPRWLNEFRRLLAQAANDPNFSIVTHPLVNVDIVTGHDKFLPLIPFFDAVKGRIFAGLFVSDAIISGEKTPFASGVTFMKGLMHRYLTFRNSLTGQLKTKIFANLSRMRGFYEPTQAEVSHRVRTPRADRLIIPEVYWQKANLLSNQAIMQMFLTLREKKEVPMKYVADLFGFDYDDMMHQMKREMGTASDPVWQEVRKRAVTDPKYKLHELGRRVLMGEDVVTALKNVDKEKAEVPSIPEKKVKPEGFEPPEVPGEAGEIPAEFPLRPPELPPEIPRPAAPGALPEPRPKPGEEGAGTPATEGVPIT